MFDPVVDDPVWAGGPARRSVTVKGRREPLAVLAERARPTSSSESRILPVPAPLAALLPDGGLRRGTSVTVTGAGREGRAGELTLCLSLLAAASSAGAWCATVGIDGLGAVAAGDLGIDLTRLVLLRSPGPRWAEATAALLDGVDVVLLRPPFRVRAALVRRLLARARERRAVLVVADGEVGWPEHPDVGLVVEDVRWEGVGRGDGHLRRRQVTVTATGRRAAARPRRQALWLPTETGGVEQAGPDAGTGG